MTGLHERVFAKCQASGTVSARPACEKLAQLWRRWLQSRYRELLLPPRTAADPNAIPRPSRHGRRAPWAMRGTGTNLASFFDCIVAHLRTEINGVLQGANSTANKGNSHA
jgi:hypothetical protein